MKINHKEFFKKKKHKLGGSFCNTYNPQGIIRQSTLNQSIRKISKRHTDKRLNKDLTEEGTQKVNTINIHLISIIREIANKKHNEITFHKYDWTTF